MEKELRCIGTQHPESTKQPRPAKVGRGFFIWQLRNDINMPNDAPSSIKEVIQVAITVAMPVVLGALGWFGTQTIQHGNDLAGIKANRFTAQDAFQMQADLTSSLTGIHDSLHEIEKKVPSTARMDSMETTMQRLQLDVAGLRQNVEQLKSATQKREQ